MISEKYRLKKSITVGGREYEIRSDYGVILDIIEALNDPDLDNQSKAYVALEIFYPDFEDIPQEDYGEALKECFRFINGGKDESGQKNPKLMDWEQDFPLVIGAINRVLGYDVRSIPYDIETNTGGVPWETFIAAYQEIGDCTFTNIVAIRDKMNRGKKLEKHEKEFYRRNKDIIDLKSKYSSAEKDLLARLT